MLSINNLPLWAKSLLAPATMLLAMIALAGFVFVHLARQETSVSELNDVVFEDQGVKVVVDRESLPMLDGTQVDYVRKGLNESFQFTNPNVKDECGCGESFTV